MTTYTLGQTVAWRFTNQDANGTLVNPGSGPTATITLPDASTISGSITVNGAGDWTVGWTSTQVGRVRCTITATGLNSGGFPYTDVADVWPVDPRFIIPLADARAALNVAASNRTGDDELRLYIAAATDVIENLCGPRLSATVTETRSGGGPAINLYKVPAAITSVTENGTAVASSGYCLDVGGVLWRGSSPMSGSWADGARNVVVTYAVGSSSIPSAIIVAARELVKHLVTSGQQSWRAPFSNEELTPTPVGFAVPNRVLDLLRPYIGAGVMPGLA